MRGHEAAPGYGRISRVASGCSASVPLGQVQLLLVRISLVGFPGTRQLPLG